VRRALALVLCFLVALLALAGAAEAKKKRYVAITPFAANTLVKLGIKPVAIGETSARGSHLSKKLKGVPRIPLSHASNGPNLEQLVSYNPDVVFSEATWKAGHAAIRDLGIRVYMDDPKTVAKVPAAIEKIGGDVGKKAKAKRVAKNISKGIKRSVKGITRRPRVLMVLGVGQTPYAFLGDSWGGNLITRAGGMLLTEGLSADPDDDIQVDGGYAQLSDEKIIELNPDVIIAVPHGNSEDLDEIQDSLENDTAFQATNAGSNGDIYVENDGTLVQASTDVAATIKHIRTAFLSNR
jgi:iron complex transport system substrate-binding protein